MHSLASMWWVQKTVSPLQSSQKSKNYSALGYDDKILDRFYDVYGIITGSTSSKMPSLVDLQGMSASEGVTWEVILVNKRLDANLLKLERKALVLANNVRTKSILSVSIELAEEIASQLYGWTSWGSRQHVESMEKPYLQSKVNSWKHGLAAWFFDNWIGSPSCTIV